jgi:hypothetical protein
VVTLNDDYDYEQFKKWYLDSFIKRNGGYFPKDLFKWYNKVEKTKTRFRTLLKGKRKDTFKISIKSSFNNSYNPEIELIKEKIKSLVPRYLEDNKLDDSVFYSQTLALSSHSAIKTTKHISKYAESYFKNKKYDNPNFDHQGNKESLINTLSELGKAWSKCKTNDIDLYVTISTTPAAFALMGHYGCEKDSCFRQGSNKTRHKYAIGQSSETAVITIADKKDDKFINIARFICYYNCDSRSLHLLNLYFRNSHAEGDLLESIKSIYKVLFQTEDVNIYEGLNFWAQREIHRNEYGNISLVPNDKRPSETIINIDLDDIFFSRCPRCRNSGREEEFIEIDGAMVCQGCSLSCNVCELTGQRTFKQLVEFRTRKNEVLFGIKELVEKEHPKCERCKVNFFKKEIPICEDCYDNDFVECDLCSWEGDESEFVQAFEINVCKCCVVENNHQININLIQ